MGLVHEAVKVVGLGALVMASGAAVAGVGDASAADTNLLYVGRWDRSNASVAKSYWPGAYLRAKFTGTSVGVSLAGPASFYASIDGGPDTLYLNQNGVAPLASALAAGTHTLRITAVTQKDVLQINRLVLDPGSTTVATARKPGLVEFVGDSITAGLMAPSSSNQYVRSENDYAWLAAEQLGVEHVQVAYPGICLVDNLKCWSPNNIGMSRQFFRRATVDYPTSPDWNFATYQPQAVVINLGTNDAQAVTYLNNGGTESGFQSAYEAFVRNIRAKYPVADILLLRPFGGFRATQTRAAANTLAAEGDTRVHFVDTTNWLNSGDYFPDGIHPSEAGHVKIAKMLAPLLKPYVGGLRSSFEAGSFPLASNAVLSSSNVTGYWGGAGTKMETYANAGVPSHAGGASLVYSGSVPAKLAGWSTYSFNKLYDVSIPVTPATELSYWVYPAANTNSAHVAVDLEFADGTLLRNLGAVDQNGVSMHPWSQGDAGRLPVNTWSLVKTKVGQVAAGKVVRKVILGYQNASVTGQFYGYVDELKLADAPFANGLESTDAPIVSNATLSSSNVTGYWGGNTTMETYANGSGKQHTGGSAITYSGAVTASLPGWSTYAFNKVMDVDIKVNDDTQLSYWIYPAANANSAFTSIDLVFTDGTSLRNLGAVDQNGMGMHPWSQGNAGRVLNAWNFVSSHIGAVAAGKTIQQIVVGFQTASTTGQFYGYIDDLLVH